ncbi:MAG: hypothetical protein HY744_18070 [Deltaproteobacteria bacterium]|nr:hypothetical protein [Deltaproteobacteria bacterium]
MLLALVLASGLWAAAEIDLGAAAASSGRPAECLPAQSGRDARRETIWTQARAPELVRYCQLLARAQARLADDPTQARRAAIEADRLLPGRAAPQVLLGRVAARAGETDEALLRFDRALGLDPHGVEQPLAMYELGVTLRHSGQIERSLQVLRLLVPRAALLPGALPRTRALIEAAGVAMDAQARGSGPGERPALGEALAYLREAAEDPHHAYRLDVGLGLVLVLDRAGHGAQADALLAELGDARRWLAAQDRPLAASADDLLALQALALETANPAAAAARWRQYLAALRPAHPWAPAARARVQRLEQPPRAPPGRGAGGRGR